MTLITRFFNPPTQNFFLFGPRGTGKSTLIKTRYKDAIYYGPTFLDDTLPIQNDFMTL